MENCFDFHDETSAVNKSWICLPKWNVSPVEASNDTTCFFLYVQQFNRPKWYCGHFEAIVMITLCIAAIPTNILAIRNFHRRPGTSSEFRFLIGAMSCQNIAFAMEGMVTGLARFTIDAPLGYWGCIAMECLSCFLETTSMMTLAMISNERRRCVTQIRVSSRSRLPSTILVFIIMLTLAAIFWSLPAIFPGVAQIVPVYINGVRGGVEPVYVCADISTNMPVNGVNEAAFLCGTFLLPLSITMGNYGLIWRYLRRSHGNLQRKSQRRREVILSCLMLVSLVEYTICVLPIQMAVSVAWFDAILNPIRTTLHSATIFWGHVLLIFDSAVNPFWMSLIRVKNAPKRQYNSHQTEALSLSAMAPMNVVKS